MTTAFFSLKKPYLALSITVLLLAFLAFIGQKSFTTSANFNSALTLDFALTIPLIYFLLIRKSSIPKTTIVPIFIIGLIVASYTIPVENQNLLSLIKTWVVPVVEISVLTFVIIKVRKLVLEYKQNKSENLDFFDALKVTTKQLLPSLASNLLAMEVSVLYYGFFKWKKTKLQPNQFTYHIHFLLIKWSTTAAIIALILSVYSGFQFLGFSKSLMHRPITITNETLFLKNGILAETTIPINNIASVKSFTKDIEKDSDIKRLSPLGGLEPHNILIELKKPETWFGLYGSKKTYMALVLHIDDTTSFKKTLEDLIHE